MKYDMKHLTILLLAAALLFASGVTVFAGERFSPSGFFTDKDVPELSSDDGSEETPSKDEFPVYNLSALGADSFSEMNAQNRIYEKAFDPSITVSTKNDCARWVFQVYTAAGVNCPYLSGADLWEGLHAEANTDMKDIPVGAIVIGTGRNSNVQYEDYYFGHVGICLGDIDGDGVLDVRDCTGPGPEGIHTSDINTWVSWQTDSIFGYDPVTPGFIGWVFPLQ